MRKQAQKRKRKNHIKSDADGDFILINT